MGLEMEIEKRLGAFCLRLELRSEARRIGILGASGSGKTLALKSIAGIETPDQGRISLEGRTLFDAAKGIDLKPQQRRLGYLFQSYALFPTMTVAQNIACGLKGTKEEKRCRTEEMLERFRLKKLENRLPGELSGGQKQRTALARIMAYEPALIMLDEPFSALDVYLKEQLYQEMQGMLEDYPGTVILVSHSRDEIYQFTEELFVLDQGRVVRSGKTREVFANPGNSVSARLTGCKNISRAERTGERQLYALDWRLRLQTAERVPDNLRYVGIRAHDLEPAGAEGVNCLPCRVASVSEAPFEILYLIRCPEERNAQTEGCRVFSEEWNREPGSCGVFPEEWNAQAEGCKVSSEEWNREPGSCGVFPEKRNARTRGRAYAPGRREAEVGQEQMIWWKVSKNRMQEREGIRLPEYLRLPPERLLLLTE